MPVVNRYSRGFPDPANAYASRGETAQSKVNVASFEIAVVNGDSATSVHFLARLPSGAFILPISSMQFGAITGLSSYSVGLRVPNGGTSVANTLVNAQSLAAGGTLSLVGNVAAANYDQPLWSLLGLTQDPGGLLEMFGTMNAGATANGTITGQAYWAFGM